MGWNDDQDIWYWDTNNTATGGTSSNFNITPSTYITSAATTGANTYTWHYWLYRTIYVTMPEAWSDADNEAWAAMVNSTSTGFKVTAIIKGKVCITDPNAEVRSLADFLPLLKSRAAPDDLKAISEFMAAHPVDGEGSAKTTEPTK